MYGQDRAAIREIFFRAWAKYRQQLPLEGIETLIVTVADRHPEYHALLEQPELSQHQDFVAEAGAENPFLHMGLHITLEEQLAIDRPAGIQAIYQQLQQKSDDPHAVQHRMMACLGEVIWQAQQASQAPDDAAYLECLRRLL